MVATFFFYFKIWLAVTGFNMAASFVSSFLLELVVQGLLPGRTFLDKLALAHAKKR